MRNYGHIIGIICLLKNPRWKCVVPRSEPWSSKFELGTIGVAELENGACTYSFFVPYNSTLVTDISVLFIF